MNTIWLKLAAAAVAVVIVIAIIGQFTGDKTQSTPAPNPSAQAEKPKTVYDSFDRDDKKFGVKFQGQDQPEANTPAPAPAQPAPQTAAQAPVQVQPPKQPHFEPLPIEEEVQAQKFHSMALEERKRSRLPLMTPKMMVDYCREIIRRWPKSEYAYSAKRMLADIPDRFKEMYKVTPQEMDVSSFFK